ncbi:MAG: LCP family protein [Lachnospiraceae bacterium]
MDSNKKEPMRNSANAERRTTATSSARAKKKAAQKRNRKIIIFVLEIIVLAIMLGVLWFVTRATDEEEGIQKVELATEEIVINDKVTENETLTNYRTIALFGVDSTVGELTMNTRSDTIIIASINNDTKEVKIMSVYRDTYLNLGNDTYSKCNAAYAKGGPQQAISMLNANLDLDITDFVTVGFSGLMETIDALGGVYIEISEGELEHINNYQISIAENLKIDYEPVTEAGYQLVDGLQATAYCRIRQVGNNDFARTERQREVLFAMLDEALKMDVTALTKIVNNVLGDVYTSIDVAEMITILGELSSYTVVDEGGFPELEDLTTASVGSEGSCVIPIDLESSVVKFHNTFFADETYEVSEQLKEISEQIHKDTDVYIN